MSAAAKAREAILIRSLITPATLAGLIAKANADHTEYPQYAGHFDGYVVVRVTKDVTTKAGLAFHAGQLAIANPTKSTSGGLSYMTVYSFLNKVDTSVRAVEVESV